MEDNIFELCRELEQGRYRPAGYTSFYVRDPKLRHIHKASVRDRLVFQAVFRVLYHYFDKKFISDSYSCRFDKGTHKGVARLEQFVRQASANYRNPVYALKGDIRKFFDSVNHDNLLQLIKKTMGDSDAFRLIRLIVESFETAPHKGIPLGNVTSQLFANIYLNELDQFVKHELREKYYLRYCDDFIILSRDKNYLIDVIKLMSEFLSARLDLSLHPNKLIIRKASQGIDFLGYVVLPHSRVLRTKTKRRILKKIKLKKRQIDAELIAEKSFYQTIQSYFGQLSHCRGHKIGRRISEIVKK